MGDERNSTSGTAQVNGALREALKAELEEEIRQALEAELREELSQELRERVVARLKSELAEEIQLRVARVKAELEAELLARTAPVAGPRVFERFSVNFRAQHFVLMASVVLLVLTGLPLKFHEAWISERFMDLIGGVRVSTFLHRAGAVGLIGVGAYHLFYLLAFREGRRNLLALLPAPQDVLDFFQMFRYFLGRTDQRPRFDRFSYVEKFDYWAVYWGMVIMIGSGLILWFLEASLQILPKFAADIAREAHSDEGLLATLAILIWHFYNVHLNPEFFPMNKTFLTGTITEEEMRRHHPREYERLMAGRGRPPAVLVTPTVAEDPQAPLPEAGAGTPQETPPA